MADTKLSALTELAVAPATGAELYIRDVSEATADESKRITMATINKMGVMKTHAGKTTAYILAITR